MSGLNFDIDPRWSHARRTRPARQGGIFASLKCWLGIAEPEEGRKLDIRRPAGANPHTAPIYRTRR